MEAYNLRQEDVPVIGLPFGETFDRDPVKMTESLRRFFDLAENPVPPWQIEPSLLFRILAIFLDFRLEVQTNRYRNWMSRQEMEQAAFIILEWILSRANREQQLMIRKKEFFVKGIRERRPPGLKSLFAGDGKKIRLCFATKLIWMLHDTKDECRRIPF